MSIRFLAILAVCVAVAMLWTSPFDEITVSHSGREFDVAIIGRGNFVVVDSTTADVGYTRRGNLYLNEFGQLAVDAATREWTIDPPIQLPSDWERIAIQNDGRVQSLVDGTWLDVGQFQLAEFARSPAFADELAINKATDDLGPPHIGDPLDDHGVLQQGWIAKRRSSIRIVARNLLLALLSSIVVNSFVARGSPQTRHKTPEP